MLKARPCALPRCADRPDPLATLDTVPDPNGDLGEVAIDRSEAVRIMVDDDDQTAQVAVVTCDGDRKSTRLNSSHSQISYAVFCLKKKTCAKSTPEQSRQAATVRSCHRKASS